jgi:nucleoid DNA-binding protein
MCVKPVTADLTHDSHFGQSSARIERTLNAALNWSMAARLRGRGATLQGFGNIEITDRTNRMADLDS